jgi:uncharacterized cupredoxin-like copper-binding protein
MLKSRSFIALAVAALLTGALAGCGADSSDAPGGNRTVDDGLRVVKVEMTEMAFNPAKIDVTSGETIRLRFHNSGVVMHDAVIGDLAFQERREMAASGAGTPLTGADNVEALVVDPGDSADLVYKADAVGTFIIGCHQPGHWVAGMRADINVTG